MRFVQEVKSQGKVELDQKDKHILVALSHNARSPITEIARAVKLSRDAVAHRIRTYEQKGLIQGYRTVVDVEKFGFGNYHLFLKLSKPNEGVEQALLAKLSALPYVRAVIRFSGTYDIELAVIARSVAELSSILEEVRQCCGQYLLDDDLLIISKLYTTSAFPKSFAAELPATGAAPTAAYVLDGRDRKILAAVANTARKPLYRIAGEVGLSADAVQYRLRRMHVAGYLTKFIPAINYDMLGYQVYAILMNIRPLTIHEEATLATFLTTDPSILWAVRTIGRYGVLFYISARAPGEVHATIHRLREHFPDKIKEYEALIAEEEHQYTYVPPVLLAEQ